MQLINNYSARVLVLLAFSCPVWQLGQSLPVFGKTLETTLCVAKAGLLLRNISQALTQTDLFKGFDCADQKIELNSNSNTPFVCAPQESTCAGETKSDFDQESCLTSIKKDLSYYLTFFSDQLESGTNLRPSVLHSLKELMTCLSPSTDTILIEAAPARSSTYNERLRLCKVLKGFQVRTITINRALSYLSSAEHRK